LEKNITTNEKMTFLKPLHFVFLCFALIYFITPTVGQSSTGRQYPIPPWVTDPDGTCCVFERYPNRTFTDNVEVGQTTDFYEPWECARWCCWTENCYAFEWIDHIDWPYGGCYDTYKPCCRIFTYAWPWMGEPSYHDVRETAYLAWAPAPCGFTCDPVTGTCDATGFVPCDPGYTGLGPWPPGEDDYLTNRAQQLTETQHAQRLAAAAAEASVQAGATDQNAN
jgi:hypothetical protein